MRYYRAEAGVVVDVRISPTPGFTPTDAAVGIGFTVSDGTVAPPAAPDAAELPVILSRVQFQKALRRKGIVDGLKNTDLLAAVATFGDDALDELEHATTFASDDDLIAAVAVGLQISFTTEDWRNARSGDFDQIS